jgi:hypothetical protein
MMTLDPVGILKARRDTSGVARTLVFLLGAAAIVAMVDLGHKALAISERGGTVLLHDRPARYVVAGAALSLAWAGAVVLTQSTVIALLGGIVFGGAAGNLMSFALWPSLQGVPDPIVAGGLAFNMADAFVLAGVLLVIPTIVVFGLRNRNRLFDPL